MPNIGEVKTEVSVELTGTCETCENWGKEDLLKHEPDYRICKFISSSGYPDGAYIYAFDEQPVVCTFKTFGCTLYERRVA